MSVKRSGRGKIVAAAAAGNFVEWYDFAIYGYFSPVLARVFFPETEGFVGLLATLGVFGAAFVLRPIGAFVFGHFGDRLGRKWVLSFVILTMAGATAVMGLLPSYTMIGVWAPILLTLLRLIQGFSAGGEFGGAASLLFEHAGNKNRGLMGSAQPASIVAALAVSAGLGAGLTAAMSEEFLNEIGWRIPFLLALPLGIVGWYIRRHIDETPAFVEMKVAGTVAKSPVKVTLRSNWRMIISGTAAIVSWTAGGYVTLQFLPTFFNGVMERPIAQGLTASLVGLSIYAGFIVLGGWLADRIARWKVMLMGAIALAVFAVPCYLLLINGSVFAVGTALVLFAASLGLVAGPTPAMLAELTPENVRATYLGIVYAIANAAFGGFAPYIVIALIDSTGLLIAPALYLVVLEVIAIAGIIGVAVHMRRQERKRSTADVVTARA
ncbi:MHS family MFS transporter [Microbacterium resistens]|uniref:MFS transporter n=1 Tax=Microbacterium resistens TaxID=156977 RepID=UPI001C5A1232|nr:MFS transporter [Microbacterium resistens]MBW1638467.1 MHS family MFS transporter [Microbacterium resistens]